MFPEFIDKKVAQKKYANLDLEGYNSMTSWTGSETYSTRLITTYSANKGLKPTKAGRIIFGFIQASVYSIPASIPFDGINFSLNVKANGVTIFQATYPITSTGDFSFCASNFTGAYTFNANQVLSLSISHDFPSGVGGVSIDCDLKAVAELDI